MVERCKHCGTPLHPNEIIVAHKGNLYCDRDCAVSALVAEEYVRILGTYNYRASDFDALAARANTKLDEEAEEVKASDIGITAPLCPFMFAETDRHECTSECVAYFKGKCSIAMTFKRRMEEE